VRTRAEISNVDRLDGAVKVTMTVTVDNQLVGMIHGAFSNDLPTCVTKYVPLLTPAVTVSINAVLADLNAKNRPGAGFVPIP
jgi:hypothetical protein